MKLLIFGIPGSGKTTFSNRVSMKTGIPVFHIDRHLFEPGRGWQKRPQEDFLSDVRQCLRKDRWIIEGTGMRSLEMRYKEADLAIFCALPLQICTYRVYRRALMGWVKKEKRPDCPEDHGHRVSKELIRYMWNFRKKYGQKIQELQKGYPQVHFFEARSDKQLSEIYQEITSPGFASRISTSSSASS